MELLQLATTAFALASPFLIKSGEKIAENIGQEVWDFIKKPFSKEEQDLLLTDVNSTVQQENFKQELFQKINEDENFENELRVLVQKSNEKLANYSQQIINNNGKIEKQVNIQNQTGNIQL